MTYRFVRSNANEWLLELRKIGVAVDRNYRPNAYGTVLREKVSTSFPGLVLETAPVICGHGGSMWLCYECARAIPTEEKI